MFNAFGMAVVEITYYHDRLGWVNICGDPDRYDEGLALSLEMIREWNGLMLQGYPLEQIVNDYLGQMYGSN